MISLWIAGVGNSKEQETWLHWTAQNGPDGELSAAAAQIALAAVLKMVRVGDYAIEQGLTDEDREAEVLNDLDHMDAIIADLTKVAESHVSN